MLFSPGQDRHAVNHGMNHSHALHTSLIAQHFDSGKIHCVHTHKKSLMPGQIFESTDNPFTPQVFIYQKWQVICLTIFPPRWPGAVDGTLKIQELPPQFFYQNDVWSNCTGKFTCLVFQDTLQASPSRTLPPNSAVIGYAIEGPLLISRHPSTKIGRLMPSAKSVRILELQKQHGVDASM